MERRFAEKIIYKEFYTEKYGEKLPLIDVLTLQSSTNKSRSPLIISTAISSLNELIELEQDPYSNFSIIKIKSFEAKLSKDLAEVVLYELEQLNRFFKSQNVIDKTNFIEQRISTVERDLEISEIELKEFNEKNRQVSSPALQLELDRIDREVEIQKSIYLTLKQQLELAKIEEIQETSIVQILDKPQIPLSPSNKDIKMSIGLASLFGIFTSLLLSFFRSFLNNTDIGERKKIRKIKSFIKKKIYSFIIDRRISGTFTIMLLLCLPFYLSHKSINPKYFGMYSEKLMIFIIFYVTALLFFLMTFLYSLYSKKIK